MGRAMAYQWPIAVGAMFLTPRGPGSVPTAILSNFSPGRILPLESQIRTGRAEQNKLHPPGAVKLTVGFGKLGFGEVGFGKVGFGEVGFGKVGFGKVGFGKVGFGKVGFGEVGFGEVGFGEVGFGEVGFGELGFGEVGFGEVGGHQCHDRHRLVFYLTEVITTKWIRYLIICKNGFSHTRPNSPMLVEWEKSCY